MADDRPPGPKTSCWTTPRPDGQTLQRCTRLHSGKFVGQRLHGDTERKPTEASAREHAAVKKTGRRCVSSKRKAVKLISDLSKNPILSAVRTRHLPNPKIKSSCIGRNNTVADSSPASADDHLLTPFCCSTDADSNISVR